VRTVRLIAVNVFKESVRDKVLYNLVVFAVLLISTSYLLGQLTAGQDLKIIKDLGLASISTFGLLIAIFIGIGLVWKEVEKRSIYALLSKPMGRGELVLGKYCGLVLTLAINVVVMTVALYAVLAYMGWAGDRAAVMVSPAPPTDPAMLTAGIWVIGHFNDDLRNFGAVVRSPTAAWVGRALYYVLPNFAAFDIKAQVVHGQTVSLGYVGLTILYGLTYLTLLLVAAVTIFSRRDFK